MNDIAIKWKTLLLDMEALDLETLQENAPTSLPIEGQLLLQVTAELHKNKERTDIVRWKLLVDSSLKSLKLKVVI